MTVFYKYQLRYKWFFVFGILSVIIASILNNYSTYYFKIFFDFIESSTSLDTLEFLQLLITFLFIKLSGSLLYALSFAITDGFIIPAGKDLRIDIMSHLHDLDFKFHANRKSGSLISNMKRGDGAFFSFSHELNREIISVFTSFIFVAITFYTIDLLLGLIIVVITLFTLISTMFLVKLNVSKRNIFNKEEDKITAIIVDNMINYETVKFFAKENYEKDRLINQFIPWLSTVWKYANTFRMVDIITGITSAFGMAILIYISFYRLIDGSQSIGEFVLVLSFTTVFFPKLTHLIFRLRELAKNYTDLEKYLSILNETTDIVDPLHPVKLSEIEGNIDIKNVSFSYNDSNQILDNINVTINKGEKIAFVGESGAGKTTLSRLIFRFYDVTSGEILIDGINIKNIKKEDLRKHIAIVPQEPVLFNDSIGYNIGYGKENCSMTEIAQASEFANLDKFIDSLPEGYDTMVGERGIKLSGGQKQRLAIARAFLANPKIIIFDEATSQLDSNSEKLIQESLWKLVKDKTTIIIAHRLSTVMRSDKIIVFDKGNIVQIGKHEELIKSNGIYKNLWKLQTDSIL
jgi:ATP-binding cassette, subfamily B, heavy metal transporter